LATPPHPRHRERVGAGAGPDLRDRSGTVPRRPGRGDTPATGDGTRSGDRPSRLWARCTPQPTGDAIFYTRCTVVRTSIAQSAPQVPCFEATSVQSARGAPP